MDELEKVIEEECDKIMKEWTLDNSPNTIKRIAQAVREHLEKEGWVKKGMSYEEFLDKSKM